MAVFAALSCAVSCNSSAPKLQIVDYQEEYTVKGVTFDMVELPAGTYTMGLSSDNRRKISGAVVHQVALDGFAISSRPVSQALWTAVMGKNPSTVQQPDAPVDMVSWTDACKFLRKLGKLTGKSFAMPSEAQWEYAQKQLADGFGTVAEWCSDTFSAVPDGLATDDDSGLSIVLFNPAGTGKGDGKVVRTVHDRVEVGSHTKKQAVGFRLVQDIGEAIPESLRSALEGRMPEREKVDVSDRSPETITVGNVSFRMVKVAGGEFTLGFTQEDNPYFKFTVPENEQNAHKVALDDFEIGETEVTAALWNAVMGSVPYLNDMAAPQKPVVNVSWYNCQNFILKLNEMTGRKFRLPTEAEWEYAARGGQKSRKTVYSGSDDSRLCMWFLDNADMKVKDVAGLKPNELGIYDMSGNAWEWCLDGASDYTKEEQTNPLAPSADGNRILRGGSAASRWDACRVTNRSFMPAKNVKGTFGLRLAL